MSKSIYSLISFKETHIFWLNTYNVLLYIFAGRLNILSFDFEFSCLNVSKRLAALPILLFNWIYYACWDLLELKCF